MSVLVEFAMFPTDKGESVSLYVSRILDAVDRSGVPYKITPMGTVFETDTLSEALGIIEMSYNLLGSDCNRVYATVKFDIRKGKSNRLKQKIESLEKKVGRRLSS